MIFSVIIRCKNEDQWIGHSIQSVIDILPIHKKLLSLIIIPMMILKILLICL